MTTPFSKAAVAAQRPTGGANETGGTNLNALLNHFS
jgi:hypothetical protein